MCTGRQDIPFVQNVIEAKWSPDSKRLAVTAGQRTPSTASPVGWKEEEVVYTFDLRSGALSRGRIRDPAGVVDDGHVPVVLAGG